MRAASGAIEGRPNDVFNAEIQGCGRRIETQVTLRNAVGIVFDSRSDEPVPGASVMLTSASGGACGTTPIAFAVRDVAAGTDLDAIAQPGQGMALWLHAPDAQDIHDALAAAGTTIVSAPIDGPFGRTFTFADPDGYQVTLHDRG